MRYLITLVFICCSFVCLAQQGKHGVKVIAAANVIVNEYTAVTANVAAGATSVTVTNSALNTNSRFAGALAAGDLVMIIQMRGATINGTPNDSTWGAITSYNNCGLNEIAEVTSVPNATTINVNCPLKNNYTATGKVQVVRIPRYTTLTINANDTLTCTAWDGTIGGVLSVEVKSTTTINATGAINASAKGFRGGRFILSSSAGTSWPAFKFMTIDSAGEKGESIAGFSTDYNIYGGAFGRGAPANAGGGGNRHNAGGGGGGNAGLTAYTGNGNPDVSNASWVAAWNLEYSGFATATSSGGGRGGYTMSSAYENPLAVPPGDARWMSDNRQSLGGKGGRPLDYSTGRLFMGGGGGGGHADNPHGGAGGAGGGLIYIMNYDVVTGNGVIMSNGQPGFSSCCAPFGDGAGGGGAGGTVMLNSKNTISGISIQANGGKGGNQVIGSSSEAEGPGGGGGGGYIAISNGSITRQAVGGFNGTTDAPTLPAFIPNGATKGGDGIPNASVAGLPVIVANARVAKDTVCAGDPIELFADTVAGATYQWFGPNAYSSNQQNPVVSNTSLASSGSYVLTVTVNGCSSAKDTVVAMVKLCKPIIIGDTIYCFENFNHEMQGVPSGGTFTGCGIVDSGGKWFFNSALAAAGATVFPFKCIITYTQPNGLSTTQTMTVNRPENVDAGEDYITCTGEFSLNATTTNTGAFSYAWTPATGLDDPLAAKTNGAISSGEQTYYIQLTNTATGCKVVDSITIFNDALTATILLNRDTICVLNDVVAKAQVTPEQAVTYRWNMGDGFIATEPTLQHTYNRVGSYKVVLMVQDAYCTARDTEDLYVTDFHIRLTTNDTIVEKGSTIILLSAADMPYHVLQWKPAGLFSDDEAIAQTITVQESGREYIVIGASDRFNCIDSARITIRLNSQVYIPDAFTPNGDGLNDYFRPIGAGGPFTVSSFRIFDRWGQVVFTAEGATAIKGWDGTYGGQPAELGVYFYIIQMAKYNGEQIDTKGEVTLIR